MERLMHNYRYKKFEVITLEPEDVKSAVMQYICSCYPEYEKGNLIKVKGAAGCVAVVLKIVDDPTSSATKEG